MNEYSIRFKLNVGSAGAIPDVIVKADSYSYCAEGFIDFFLSAEEESIASFATESVLSIIKTIPDIGVPNEIHKLSS